MKLSFLSKSLDYLNDQPLHTRVVLGNDEGAYYPVFLPPDAITTSDAELFVQALDIIYEENHANRFEKEKFAEHEQTIAAINAEVTKLKEEALAEIRQETEQNRELIRLAMINLNDGLAQLDELLEQAEENTDDATGNDEETDRGGLTDE